MSHNHCKIQLWFLFHNTLWVFNVLWGMCCFIHIARPLSLKDRNEPQYPSGRVGKDCVWKHINTKQKSGSWHGSTIPNENPTGEIRTKPYLSTNCSVMWAPLTRFHTNSTMFRPETFLKLIESFDDLVAIYQIDDLQFHKFEDLLHRQSKHRSSFLHFIRIRLIKWSQGLMRGFYIVERFWEISAPARGKAKN